MNSNRGNRIKNKDSIRMIDDPGKGDWTSRVKRVGEDRQGLVNEFYAMNPMS